MIISLYAHAMSVRESSTTLRQIYEVELSHEAISDITDAVLEEPRTWQTRGAEAMYPVVFLDAIAVKVRDNHSRSEPALVAEYGELGSSGSRSVHEPVSIDPYTSSVETWIMVLMSASSAACSRCRTHW
jgi:transposase-like protein